MGIVLVGNCPSGELSWWGIVLVGSCPGGELSGWELSGGELSGYVLARLYIFFIIVNKARPIAVKYYTTTSAWAIFW